MTTEAKSTSSTTTTRKTYRKSVRIEHAVVDLESLLDCYVPFSEENEDENGKAPGDDIGDVGTLLNSDAISKGSSAIVLELGPIACSRDGIELRRR